jgi:hypothetical protein
MELWWRGDFWKDELNYKKCPDNKTHRPVNSLRPEQKKNITNLKTINAGEGPKNPTGPNGVLSGP